MRKIAKWLAAISIAVFAIDWGVIGLKLLDGNYDITADVYIGLILLVVFFVSVLYVKLTNRCPHCGKMKQSFGKYCPYCGKEIN
ncbi:MAG: zinc ribbon domain-containing protein [Oscillibacter sp.]|nr:zinc ribbon domain-containing protein [Oscillibacter sp.]